MAVSPDVLLWGEQITIFAVIGLQKCLPWILAALVGVEDLCRRTWPCAQKNFAFSLLPCRCHLEILNKGYLKFWTRDLEIR